MKQLSIALFQYEQERGHFPRRIDDLVSKEAIDQGFLDETFERTPKMVGFWWYQSPSVKLSAADPADTPLIMTPSINGKHTILRIDGSARQMDESVAFKIITAQNSVWIPIRGVDPKLKPTSR